MTEAVDPARRTILKFSLAGVAGSFAACGGGASADGAQAPSATPPGNPQSPAGGTTTPPDTTPTPPATTPGTPGTPANPVPLDPANQPAPPPPNVSPSPYFAGWVVQKRKLTDISRHDDKGLPAGGKHTSWAQHPNGRAYLFGGDWSPAASTGGNAGSGNQIQYSLDPGRWADDDPTTAWRLEHEYWPSSGNTLPLHHDKSAVAWDSRRRVFWMVGGFNFVKGGTVAPQYDAPAGVVPTAFRVMRFDPTRPRSTQWSDTGVAYQTNNNPEGFGNAVYDPVLDVVISYLPSADVTRLQVWDCGAQVWLNNLIFNSFASLAIPRSGYAVSVVAIDPVHRIIWVLREDGYSNAKNLVKVSLPASRGSRLVAGAASLDLSANAVQVWSNPANIAATGGHLIEDGRTRKLYFWKKGPIGNDARAPGNDIGGAAFGTAGRPFTNNGNYGSSDTGFLLDLDTGAQEFTQLPMPSFSDGIGWLIPNITRFDPRNGILWYGTAQFEGADGEVPLPTVEARMTLLKRKRVPAWVENLPINAWYAIPGSTCETQLPADIRNVWSGPESSGYRENTLNQYQSPWSFSGMALRKRDSVCLFHGGGGGDGRGNGILGFVLNAETPGWTLPMPPAPKSQTISTWTSTGSATPYTHEFNHTAANHLVESMPKTPVAVHAYTTCHYIDAEDLWLRFGSQMVWPTDQGFFTGVHGFYWSETAKSYPAREWQINARADVPAMTGETVRGYYKHPWTEDVVAARGINAEIKVWRRASNTWITMGAISPYTLIPVGIDPVANVCLLMAGTAAPSLVDLVSGTVHPGSAASWTGPAASEFAATLPLSALMTWDDDNQCLWALKANHGTGEASFDLFKLSLVAKAGCVWGVSKVSTTVAAGSVRPDFVGLNQSIYNRFQWVPELGGIVLSTGYTRPIWFIKTSARF